MRGTRKGPANKIKAILTTETRTEPRVAVLMVSKTRSPRARLGKATWPKAITNGAASTLSETATAYCPKAADETMTASTIWSKRLLKAFGALDDMFRMPNRSMGRMCSVRKRPRWEETRA